MTIWKGRLFTFYLLFLRYGTVCVETLSSNIFEDRFPLYVLTVVNQFIVILMGKKRCCLSLCGYNSDSNYFSSCTCILTVLCVYACANCIQNARFQLMHMIDAKSHSNLMFKYTKYSKTKNYRNF